MAFMFENDIKAFFFCLTQLVIAVVVSYSFSNCTPCENKSPDIAFQERILERVFKLEFDVEQIKQETEKARDVTKYLERRNRDIDELSHSFKNLSESQTKFFTESLHVPLVAFHAYNPIDTNLQVNQVIVFQTNPLNEGNGYNQRSGVFTIPVTGLYQFSAHICNQDNAMFIYAIVLEGQAIALTTQRDMPSSCNTVNALTLAVTGQQVSVQGVHMSTSYQIIENRHRKNSFNGVLLQKM